MVEQYKAYRRDTSHDRPKPAHAFEWCISDSREVRDAWSAFQNTLSTDDQE